MPLRIFLAALCALLMTFPADAQASYGVEWGTGEIICSDDGDSPEGEVRDESYARAAEWDRRIFGQGVPGCGDGLTPLDGGTWGQSAPFTGADAEGRMAEFRLYVLSDQYAWKLGSASQILDEGREADLGAVLSTPEFSARFCSAQSAFAVGAASHEGPTLPNQRLAGRRAATVAGQLARARADCPVGQIPILFSINLGEFQNPAPSSDSAPQRRVVIIAAEDATLGVNIREALRGAIESQNVLRDFSVADYDLFEVDSW